MVREGIEENVPDRTVDGYERYMSDITNRLLGWDGRGAGFTTCNV